MGGKGVVGCDGGTGRGAHRQSCVMHAGTHLEVCVVRGFGNGSDAMGLGWFGWGCLVWVQARHERMGVLVANMEHGGGRATMVQSGRLMGVVV